MQPLFRSFCPRAKRLWAKGIRRDTRRQSRTNHSKEADNGEPWNECRKLDDVTQMCVREGEAIGSMKIDAGYLYRNDRLSVIHIKADSAAAFDPLLATLIKRYGAPRALKRGKGFDYAQWQFSDGRLHLTRTGSLVIAQFAAGR